MTAEDAPITIRPTVRPSDRPTVRPSDRPTVRPSDRPTVRPSDRPTVRPSDRPTVRPSDRPTVRPSDRPTVRPSDRPTVRPSDRPTVRPPTVRPADRPAAYFCSMPRPKSILWVDDEVESLTSHILFLEEQGFAVETSTHGDDALVLLQRQPYGVVLLDEQMPGRRGLDLFQAIRAIDHGMPVVMVTKSEEPETLKDAIGADVSDYLIKPVNPRQILSVVTRLLEGDRIRQQRLSRDFATRFRELEARRGSPLAWREWIEVVVELAEWEVRLGQADEPGLQDALQTLQDSLRQDFARYLQRNYANWLHEVDSDRPPLSVDIGAEFLRPVLDLHGRVMLVVVDCLRLDQWAMIRPLISARFDIETAHYFSILPTATPFARNAIFSGLFPAEIKARYPKWWHDNEDASLNAHEAELLTEHMRELTGRAV